LATVNHSMKHTFLLLLFLFAFTANAQFSKADARITERVDGPTLVTLTDSIKIAIGVQESGWYPVKTKAIVPKSAVSSDSVLFADTELLNQKKDPIGKVVAETKVQLKQAEGRGLYKYYEVLIAGYIKGTDLHYRSIPERGLENILRESRVSTRQEELERYFKKLDFKRQDFDNFTVWVYFDDAGSLEQPAYRTLVLFKGETLLYGVVSRSEYMSFEKLKDEREHSTGLYYFFQRPPDRTWGEIKDIVWGFIPL
jgi:hypothetical protein